MKLITKTSIIIFCLSFAFMFFLTADVPPHWESHLFVEGAFSNYLPTVFLSIAKLGDAVATASHGPVNVLYYRTLFFVFGYEFILYRLVKSLFFAGTILSFFLLSTLFLKLRYALMSALFLSFSFPIFIQTFVFDEGFIIGEFFKMAALYVFFVSLQDISIKKRCMFFVLALLAIRTYTPAFSIVGTVFGYLALLKREKIKYYLILIFLLLLLKFPTGPSAFTFGDSSYGFKVAVAKKVFFENIPRFVFSPLPKFSELYYRPYVSVLTFFGFWLFLFSIFIVIFKNYLHLKLPNVIGTEQPKSRKEFILFFSLWFLCELPILFFLPEHAIRYTAALTAPIVLLFCTFFQRSFDIIQVRSAKYILTLFFISLLLVNISYATLFRATWGSAFIGMEEVSSFIRDNLPTGKKAKLFYYATSAAPEYHVVEVNEAKKYTVSQRVLPLNMDLNSISVEFLEKEKTEVYDVYVVKRVTSFGRSEYPSIHFEEYTNLKHIKTIEGKKKGLFDLTVGRIMSLSNYHPNTFYVYQLYSQG